jgi:hypothetical protein
MTSQYTHNCKECGERVVNGQPCPVCNAQTPFSISKVIPDEPKKSVNITAIIGFLIFLIVLGFTVFNGLEVFFGSGSIPSVFTTPAPPTATPLPLPEEDMPDIIIHPVGECRVEGEVDTVTPYKVEIRQIGETLLTQFQTDDGEFVTSLLPSFGGRKFLLVCIDKEVGPTWAKTYGETFFTAIGAHPINDITGKEDASTIAEGFWLFPNPEKFRPANPTAIPGGGIVPTEVPQPTTTPLPPEPTATAIPKDSEIQALFNEVVGHMGQEATDQAFTNGNGQAWFVFNNAINLNDLINRQGNIVKMLANISTGVTLVNNGHNNGQWWLVTISQEKGVPLAAVKINITQTTIPIPSTGYQWDLNRWGQGQIFWRSRGSATTWWKSSDGSYEIPYGAVYVWPSRPIPVVPTMPPIPTAQLIEPLLISSPTPIPTPWPTPPFIPAGGDLSNLAQDFKNSDQAQWTCSSEGKNNGFYQITCLGATYSLYPASLTLLNNTVYVADYEVPPYRCVQITASLFICPAE